MPVTVVGHDEVMDFSKVYTIMLNTKVAFNGLHFLVRAAMSTEAVILCATVSARLFAVRHWDKIGRFHNERRRSTDKQLKLCYNVL